MVKKMLLCVACSIVAIMIGIAILQMRRCLTCERIAESQTMPAAEIATASSEMPLTEAEIMECSHAVEAIANACSNLQFEAMQELFNCISNKIVRIGLHGIEKVLDPLSTMVRQNFWPSGQGPTGIATVSDFDRYINTNMSAVKMLGYTMIANGRYDSRNLEYDLVVYRVLCDSLKKYSEEGNEQLAVAAKSHLDEWKEYLASGQSVTRMQFRCELKGFLKLPRWMAEDRGMKSEEDWVAYMRNLALKFHEQYYGVVPKWLDEEFPLPAKSEETGGL